MENSRFIKTIQELVNVFAAIRSEIEQGAFILIEWKVQRETRKLILNDKMWAMLKDIHQQLLWEGMKLSMEEWKDLFTSSLRSELKVVPTIDMGDGQRKLVVLGMRTSKMTNSEMSLLIEFMSAFGNERRVFWSDPKDPINSEEPG